MDILDLDWQVNLDDAYKTVGPDIVRCGNIDPVIVQNKTADEIKDITRSILEKEKGRKHIISAGCEITVNTPVENLLAMRESSYNF
jgi:uroporphyrinogen-III decarboxylase